MRKTGAEDLRSSVRIGWTGWQGVGPVREEITRGLSWVVGTGRRLVRAKRPPSQPAVLEGKTGRTRRRFGDTLSCLSSNRTARDMVSAPCHRRPHHKQGSVNPPLRSLQFLCKHTDASPRPKFNAVTNYKTAVLWLQHKAASSRCAIGLVPKTLLSLRREVEISQAHER